MTEVNPGRNGPEPLPTGGRGPWRLRGRRNPVDHGPDQHRAPRYGALRRYLATVRAWLVFRLWEGALALIGAAGIITAAFRFELGWLVLGLMAFFLEWYLPDAKQRDR